MRHKKDGGFTLPEVMVALVIISGVILSAMDAQRAFISVLTRSQNVANALTERAVVGATRLPDGDPEALQRAALRIAQQRAARVEGEIETLDAAGEISALVVTQNGAPQTTIPVRVNAPSPCAFDPVSRTCRR
jgi:prepilin-type N-terminal cleavage/methylation domain-containing protein